MNENEITLLTQIELIYCRGNLSEYISCQMGNWQALTLKFVSFYLFIFLLNLSLVLDIFAIRHGLVLVA